MLTVLSVAYPLAPVGPDAVGGAEQILGILDRALAAKGHGSIVVACEGSQVAGRLVATPIFPAPFDDGVKCAARQAQVGAMSRVLAEEHVDIVHMHTLDFEQILPLAPAPVLATLHLPLACYSAAALNPARPRTWLHCVSQAQHVGAPSHFLPPVANGLELDRYGGFCKRDIALFLGRICPEKGVHLAIEAARRAGMPLMIAGKVFDYPEHLAYFEHVVLPLLCRSVHFLGPLGGRDKRRALATARCVLVPSQIAETSSLVAREAAASGTPVIAFRRGALAETVIEGLTGFLVDDVAEMAEAMKHIHLLDAGECRLHAVRHFGSAKMVDSYLQTYHTLIRL